MKQCILIFMLLFALQSCNDDDVVCGGHCVYDTIPGTALIQVIVPDTLTNRLCNNAVFVYFDFIPADSSAPDSYRFPNWPDTSRRLLIADGIDPPSTWIEAEGLGVGTEHDCIRLEEIRGSCASLLFELPNIDYSGWTGYCQPME
jgi:hypothetical protein